MNGSEAVMRLERVHDEEDLKDAHARVTITKMAL